MKAFIVLMLLSCLAFAGTSEEHRQNLKYQATLGAGVDYWTSTTQLQLSKFIKPDQLATLKIGARKSGEENVSNVAAQYKFFLGNSFYLAPEIFYLNYFRKYANRRLTSIGAGLKIGNQWQWEHFTLGVDWIGVGENVAYFKRDNSYGTRLARSFAMSSLVYLGWSWL